MIYCYLSKVVFIHVKFQEVNMLRTDAAQLSSDF